VRSTPPRHRLTVGHPSGSSRTSKSCRHKCPCRRGRCGRGRARRRCRVPRSGGRGATPRPGARRTGARASSVWRARAYTRVRPPAWGPPASPRNQRAPSSRPAQTPAGRPPGQMARPLAGLASSPPGDLRGAPRPQLDESVNAPAIPATGVSRAESDAERSRNTSPRPLALQQSLLPQSGCYYMHACGYAGVTARTAREVSDNALKRYGGDTEQR
jgi:hypothetical protein